MTFDICTLLQAVAANPTTCQATSDLEWTSHYKEMFLGPQHPPPVRNTSSSVMRIPTFHIKQSVSRTQHPEETTVDEESEKSPGEVTPPSFPIYRRVLEEARNRFLEQRAQFVWEGTMLDTLERLIHEYGGPNRTLNFTQYLSLREAMQAKYPNLFKGKILNDGTVPASKFGTKCDETTSMADVYSVPQLSIELFVQLSAFHQTTDVSGGSLMHAIMRDIFMYQTRIDFYAMEITYGFVRDADVESFIMELIPLCAPLTEMPEAHYPFYLCVAVRRFAHYVPSLRRGCASARSILSSVPMEELIEVALAKERMDVPHNWFSYDSSTHVFEKYRSLDVDRDGMLSCDELKRYIKGFPPLEDPGIEGTYGELFLSRVFECGLDTYNGKIDYKKFVEFVLMVETLPSEPQLTAFWQIFDLHRVGYLTPMVLNLFLRDVYAKLEILSLATCPLEQLVIEVMDVMSCGRRDGITKEAFFLETNRAAAGVMCALMIDYHAVLMHEQRESNMSQQLAMLSSGAGYAGMM